MTSDQAVLWLVACVATLLLGGYLWGLARQAVARRARRRRFHRELASQRPSTQPAGLQASLSRDRVATVRREAENAARLAALGINGEPRNPYRQGTQEFVLWVATYHLTLAELREDAPLHRP